MDLRKSRSKSRNVAKPRHLLALAVALGSMLASFQASATDVQACLAASEKGQRARGAGKLREARDSFLVCGGEGCPAIVRRDCAQWQGDIVNMLPGVVFGAKDKQGRDLFDVTVSMDGEMLVKKLDGKSVIIDPGPHTFKFEIPGQPPVTTERVLVKEGEKARVITVNFTENGGSVGSGDSATTSNDPDRKATSNERGHTVLPWIVVGVGVATVIVGAIIIITAPALPEGCSQGSKTCTKIMGESPTSFTKRQEDAGRSEAQPTEGIIVGAIGLGVVGGGLLWHFLEPTGERTGSLRFAPWVARDTAGASLGASF